MHGFIHMAAFFFVSCMTEAWAAQPSHAAEDIRMPPHETVQVIVTTNEVTIGTRFTGTDLFIAGVLENADPLVRRQNGYDIIITMQGPIRPITMRKKERRMGVWVNADSLTFLNAPLYYALASTRELRDIAAPDQYDYPGPGIDNLPLRSDSPDKEKTAAFREEFIRLKKQQLLYSELAGAVTFGSPSLFSARFPLPTNIPVGHYTINAYLFRDGAFVDESSTQLNIIKVHLAYSVYKAAHRYSFWYGMVAVAIAVIIGLAGRLLFRHD